MRLTRLLHSDQPQLRPPSALCAIDKFRRTSAEASVIVIQNSNQQFRRTSPFSWVQHSDGTNSNSEGKFRRQIQGPCIYSDGKFKGHAPLQIKGDDGRSTDGWTLSKRTRKKRTFNWNISGIVLVLSILSHVSQDKTLRWYALSAAHAFHVSNHCMLMWSSWRCSCISCWCFVLAPL